jgi:hypothetical protein
MGEREIAKGMVDYVLAEGRRDNAGRPNPPAPSPARGGAPAA